MSSSVSAPDGKDGDDASRKSEDPLTDPSTPPVHPISSMQAAFNESIMEAHDPSAHHVRVTLDAATRRLQLLELDDFSEEYSSRWRQKPGAKFHPLFKLVAQVSFGVHLLHQRLAKSDEDVVIILQAHIDDIDGFIEDSQADFDLAIRDINERLRYLRMPLEHGQEFDRMLDNRDFRASIIEGNDIIERIIYRTARAMRYSVKDVKKGVEATAEFAKYLDRIGRNWIHETDDLRAIYDAMRGNAEGWYQCFNKILSRGRKLTQLLEKLESTVNEVARRAGIASRRNTDQARVRRTPVPRQPSGLRQPHQKQHSRTQPSVGSVNSANKHTYSVGDKPLPPDPLVQARTVKAILRSTSTQHLSSNIISSAPSIALPRRSPARVEPKISAADTGDSSKQNASRQTESNALGIRCEPEAPLRPTEPLDTPPEPDFTNQLSSSTDSRRVEQSTLPESLQIKPQANISPTQAEPLRTPPPLPTSDPTMPVLESVASNIRRPGVSPIIGELKPSTSLSSHPPDLDLIRLHTNLHKPKPENPRLLTPDIRSNSANSIVATPVLSCARTASQRTVPALQVQDQLRESPRQPESPLSLACEVSQASASSRTVSAQPSLQASPARSNTDRSPRAATAVLEAKPAAAAAVEEPARSPPATIDSAYSSGSDVGALLTLSPPRDLARHNLALFPSQEVLTPFMDPARRAANDDDNDGGIGGLTALPQKDFLEPATTFVRGHVMGKRSFASLREIFHKKPPVRQIAGGGLGGHVPF